MGFGDPYHKHPLYPPFTNPKADCLHCELPVAVDERCYGCLLCNFYIHEFCGNLPETMRHPLHHQRPLTLLTLFASSSDAPTPNLCNKCQEPCSEGFAYHCPTCQFILHLKCCFTLNHEKHHHPLIFRTSGLSKEPIVKPVGDHPHLNFKEPTYNCNICGYPVKGFHFVCRGCKFFIHYDCSIIPPTIKHHHTHQLTIRYDFPEECYQVYCDICEDKDGELDRTLSYYYCKECDYIAHVPCVTQPKIDAMLFKLFTHEHPLRFVTKDLLCCNQCDYSIDTWREEYPSLIKHPRYPEHTLTYDGPDRPFKCTNCEFTLHENGISFVHPYTGNQRFLFCTDTYPFRCNICGELGIGSRVNYMAYFEFHLECLALPGKLKHESHPQHPLYLSSNPEYSLFAPTCQCCSVCNEEIDQEWIYCCLDCYYVAHLNCVANDLLSTLRSSIENEPGFCAIIEPDKTSFELHIAKIDPNSNTWPPEPLFRKPVNSKEDEEEEEGGGGGGGEEDAKRFADLVVEEVDGAVCCPRCNLRIFVRAKDS